MIVSKISKTSEPYIRQGYDIIEPPAEFRGRFEMDMQAALMNIAGISISNVTKFITYDNLCKCYTKYKNPFSTNILTIGTKDKLSIMDFFHPEMVPMEIYSKPLFIHFDCSVSGDRTGIGCDAAMGYKYENEYDIEKNEIVPTKELIHHQVFTIGIQCPSGAEISFQKSREFIYYLKYTLGWNIVAISTDGFQSVDMRQQFITMGFEDTTLVSLDRTPNGYLALKSAINEGRVSMANIPELETEIIRLEQNNMTGKVDHPPDGSKDMADGFAGALYNASIHDGTFTFYLADSASIIQDTNTPGRTTDKESLLNSLVTTRVGDRSSIGIIDNFQDKVEQPQVSLKDAMKDYMSKNKPVDDSGVDQERIQRALDIQRGITRRYSNSDYEDLVDSRNGMLIF